MPGYEADDIIATLATEAEASGMDVLIVTGDRDAFQLVSDAVTVLKTGRGISETTRFTPEVLMAKYGLTPAQYPDFAAVRGDPSDNLPNIPGVGEKTAAKWITEFGSLTELADRVDEVKGKAGDKLREHLGDVLRNRQLTELARDVPLDGGRADLRPVPWDREQIHQLFDTLQFRVLRDRLYTTLPNGIGVPPAGRGRRRPRPGGGRRFDVERRPARRRTSWPAGWPSTPAARGPHRAGRQRRAGAAAPARLDGLALATPDGAGAFIDPAALTEDDEQALAGWLADPAQAKALHDAKGPLHALAARGLELAGLTTRHRAGRLPGAARPALLRPGRPGAALPGQGAGRGGGTPTGQLTLDLSGDEDGEARGGDRAGAARPGHRRAGRRAGRRPGPARRQRAAARRRAAAGQRAGRDGAGRDRRRHRSLRGHVGQPGRRGEGGRAGRVRGRRARVQPGLAQAAAGSAVHRAGPAQDQADQDRVHHRLRGADQPARADRAPGAGAPAAATATWPS